VIGKRAQLTKLRPETTKEGDGVDCFLLFRW